METKIFRQFLNSKNIKVSQFDSLCAHSQYEKLYKVASKFPAKTKVLDWGCGSGHFSLFLQSKNFDYTSFSFCDGKYIEDRARHIKGNTSQPVILPFDNESFECIASIGVLEHVHESGGNQKDSVKEILRILKPNGFFIIYHLPNKYSWIELLANFLKKIKIYNSYTHTKKFDEVSFKSLLSEDWKIIKSERYGILPRNFFNKFPQNPFIKSDFFVNSYQLLDHYLSKILSPICQNYLWILQKKGDSK